MRVASASVTPFDSRILDLSWDGIFLLAPDGTILFWNRGAEEMYGWRRDEALGRTSHSLFRTRFPEPLDQILHQLRLTGYWSGELVQTTRDGRDLIVSSRWAMEWDERPSASPILEINRNLAERRAERESVRLAAIVESSADAIISEDFDGIVRTWNSGAERLFGYSKTEAIGQPIHILAPPGRADEELNILCRIRSGERVPYFDTVRLRKDGTALDVWLTVLPIKDRRGEIIGASHVARDITERKRFEREIRSLSEQLERRVTERTLALAGANRELAETNRELESFSYSVSHDLRAPLRAIDGFTRLALEESARHLDAAAKERLHRIRAAASRMGTLIDALLDLSRLTLADIRREHVGLSAIASHIARELERTSPDRRVKVRIQPGLTTIGDPRLLRVLLANLLGNAFKFTAAQPEAVIEFGCRPDGSPRAYFVRDNGVGFDLQYASQLFVPFQRLQARTEFEGTGIGLATVRRVVTRHGGRIWADAQPGKGATFFFTLEPDRQSGETGGLCGRS